MLAAALGVGAPAMAQEVQNGQNGTTLAAYKTLDICTVDDGIWRYSGVIAVWNEGVQDTSGLKIEDVIQNKTGKQWLNALYPDVFVSGEIPAGTTKLTATSFPYSIEAGSLAGAIRNSATVTILNHSGQLGKAFGPSPKATYSGTMPPPPCDPIGCVYTQGYWGNKSGVVWPSPYSRESQFFTLADTWQMVMDTSVAGGNAYYQLAHQYIAAVLNKASGAPVPSAIDQTLALATSWFDSSSPGQCGGSACGTQKAWAEVLDKYNNGTYPGGPAHCN